MTNEHKDIEQRIRWLITQRNRVDDHIKLLLTVWEEQTNEDWETPGFSYKAKISTEDKKRTKTCTKRSR